MLKARDDWIIKLNALWLLTATRERERENNEGLGRVIDMKGAWMKFLLEWNKQEAMGLSSQNLGEQGTTVEAGGE